ncbi:hypothetical protein Tco_0063132 [Tanacetum coccineum]
MATEGRATAERDIEVVVWWQRLLPWMVLLRVLAVVGDEGEEECGKDSPEKPVGEDGGSPKKSAGKRFLAAALGSGGCRKLERREREN